MPAVPHCTARAAATHAEDAVDLAHGRYGRFTEYAEQSEYYDSGHGHDNGYALDCDDDHGLDHDELCDLEGDAEEYGCWLVALTAVDGKSYVYRVYAPPEALLGDLFWEAWHCHDEGPHPRAYDLFDTAAIRHIGNLHQD